MTSITPKICRNKISKIKMPNDSCAIVWNEKRNYKKMSQRFYKLCGLQPRNLIKIMPMESRGITNPS